MTNRTAEPPRRIVMFLHYRSYIMDFLILIILLASFFGLLILIPLLIIKAKASMNSAKITLGDAWKLYLRRTARKPILQALSIAQKNDLPITLEQIETHYFASGDPKKVVNALANNLGNKEITFQRLSTIDLAGKDIESAISANTKIHTIEIRDFKIKSFKLDYQASYKLGLYSVFGDKDSSTLEEKVTEKLHSFASAWESDDPINTQKFLQTNILTTEYWERVLGAQLIDHSFHIKI